jgi:hypothetical protein
MGDRRRLAYQEKIAAVPMPDLNALPVLRGRVTIHHGGDDVLDVAHPERLGWSNERVIRTGCGHNVARALKEPGELAASVRSALFD